MIISVYSVLVSIIALVVLTVASYTDIKTREVPDWLNYGLIGVGFALNGLFSIVRWDNSFIINSLIGFGIFFIFAYIMFYAGQWGGGDSKILMGLGALLGFNGQLDTFPFMISFLINLLIVGAVYGLLWSISLVFRNFKKFKKEYFRLLGQKKYEPHKRYMHGLMVVVLIFFILPLVVQLRIVLIASGFLIISTYYLWFFIKAVENVCMFKLVKPMMLTEGDWIAKDVMVGRKRICGPKDLGINKSQIRTLVRFYNQGKVKKIMIKEGIPFVPSFWLGFVVTMVWGNLTLLFITF